MQSQLDELYSEKANGANIRSRARWIEKGEKSCDYDGIQPPRFQSSHQLIWKSKCIKRHTGSKSGGSVRERSNEFGSRLSFFVCQKEDVFATVW